MPTRLADAGTLRKPSAASRWIDARLNDAAAASARLSAGFRRRRRVAFVEQSDGSFAPLAAKRSGLPVRFEKGRFSGAGSWRGCEVDLRLAPARCVFRELELPARATEFLEGVVRAQIDRITPWRANEAAFGWSAPQSREGERIAVWVAVVKKALAVDLAEAATAEGADSVTITAIPIEGSAPVEVYGGRAGVTLRLRRWRLGLIALLFIAIGAGIVGMIAQAGLGASLENQIDAVNAGAAKDRAALLRRENAADDPAARALEVRKRATAPTVVVLEALTRAIPDDAYLTEMRLEGDRLEIAGVGANAANLIHAVESSSLFARATFAAPTTRSPDDNGEAFRIEAHIKPGSGAAR